MNIEELLNKIYTSDLLSSEELHELTEWVCNKDKEIERLNKENKLLKSNPNFVYAMRNNKAIEYIEKNSYATYETQDDINLFIVRLDTCEDLLDILKGVETE